MKRHDIDLLSLTFGLVFTAVVGWWLLAKWASGAVPGAGWFIAAALIVFGTVGILTTVRSSRRHGTAGVQEGETNEVLHP